MKNPEKSTARRVGLSKEKIVEVATRMSEEQGIDGWSMRSLSTEIDVVPSVLYHYFSNKDEVCNQIIENLTLTLTIPDESLDWKDWFTQLLQDLRHMLIRYQGVTERLRKLKLTESSLPIIDLGLKKLKEAGFGTYAPMAHAIIMNVAISAISARNVRKPETSAPYHQLSSTLEDLNKISKQSDALAEILENVLMPLTSPSGEQVGREFFDILITCILNGVESTLLPLAKQES